MVCDLASFRRWPFNGVLGDSFGTSFGVRLCAGCGLQGVTGVPGAGVEDGSEEGFRIVCRGLLANA